MKIIQIPVAIAAASVTFTLSAGWRVAGPETLKPYEKTAIAELNDYLAKRLGSHALTVDGATDVTFHVGDTALAAEKGLASACLKDEEWVISSFGGDVVINGGGTRGCLYGTYHFIEDQLGVRFWSEQEEDVPAPSPLALPKLARRGKPYFMYRDIYRNMRPNESTSKHAIRRRLNRNGEVFIPAELGGGWKYGPPFHAHSVAGYFGKNKTAHPEWYALKDGKRQTAPGKSVLCVTNPDMRREFARKLRDYIAQGVAEAKAQGVEPPPMYDISMDDTPGTCECPNCKAEEEKYGVSGVYLRLYNELARMVAKEYPGLYVSTLAYYFTEDLPKGGVVPEKNLIIRLCDTRSNQAASINEPGNDVFLKLLRQWGPVTENLFVWDYAAIYAKTTKSFPFPSEFYYGDQWRAYAENGVKGVFLEHEEQKTGDLWDIKYYLETKLYEDPFQDDRALLKQAMTEYFGPAAPYVSRIRRQLDKLRKDRKAFIGWTPELGEFDFLHPEDVAKMQKAYDLAEAACKGEERFVRRVRRARLGTDDIGKLIASFDRFRHGDGFRFPPDDLDRVGHQFTLDTKIVDDPESPTKRAMEVKFSCDPVHDGFSMPFLIGVRDQSALKTVYQKFYREAEDPLAAKGYTVFELKDVVFPKDSFIFTTRTWQIQQQTGYPQLTAGGKHWDIRVYVRYTPDTLYVGGFDVVPHRENEDPAEYWDFKKLSRVPKYRANPYPESDYPGMKALLVNGAGPNGSEAEFFCYYAVPKGKAPAGGWPGVVLEHGAGGTAYPNYVEDWTKQGFAVIATDWYNRRPAPALTNVPPAESSVPRVDLAGGRRWDHVANVANMVIAHSLLGSFPEVNADRTVFVGLSWGSFYGAIVAAVDPRFKGVVNIYCGDRNPDRARQEPRHALADGRFLRAAKVPVWWVVSTSDGGDVVPATENAGFRACPTFAGATIVNYLPHSHCGFGFPAVARAARHFVGLEPKSLPVLGDIVEKDGWVSAKILNPGAGIGTVKLAYTCTGDRAPKDRLWCYGDAERVGETVRAKLPEGVVQCYLAAYERGADAPDNYVGLVRGGPWGSRFHTLCGTTKYLER